MKRGNYQELDTHIKISHGLAAVGLANQKIYLTRTQKELAQLTKGDFILVKKIPGTPLKLRELFSTNSRYIAEEQGRALAKPYASLNRIYQLMTTNPSLSYLTGLYR